MTAPRRTVCRAVSSSRRQVNRSRFDTLKEQETAWEGCPTKTLRDKASLGVIRYARDCVLPSNSRR